MGLQLSKTPLQLLEINALIEQKLLLPQMKDQFTTTPTCMSFPFTIEKMTAMAEVHAVLEDALAQVITMARNANI